MSGEMVWGGSTRPRIDGDSVSSDTILVHQNIYMKLPGKNILML